MRGILRVFLSVLLALPLAAGAAESVRTLKPTKPAPNNERRIALVIGNSKYKEAPLRNPANDARAISEALAATGFQVTVIEDATQISMRRAIRTFGDELPKAAVGIFYFAGHGMQVKGANYLIPVNADIEREDEIADQAIDANLVLSKMDSAKNSLNIMILDACRNNPFARSFRSAARGLAQMEAPSGTLVSFATAPGSVASDGAGQNGLFTEHLLKAMQQPGLPIEQVFKQVRIGVTKATNDQQIPWESSSLKGDFFFTPPDPAAAGGGQQQVAMQKALQDAQKAAQDAQKAAEERMAKEREEFQKRMEQMVAEALAKQRAMLEAERKAAGGAVPAPAPPAPAPVAPAPAAPPPVAVAAPAPAAPAVPAPAAPAPVAAPAPPSQAMGNRWAYSGTDAFRRDLKHEYLVEVLGATSAGVIETTRHNAGSPAQWVYTGVPTVVGGAGAMVTFSPLVIGADIKPGQNWSNLAVEHLGNCVHYACEAQAKVAAAEKLATPAGAFDTLRVELEVRLVGLNVRDHRANFTYWYAPSLKRVVKYRSRTSGAGGMAAVLAFDAELTGYQVLGKDTVGTMPAMATLSPSSPSAIQVATTAPVAGLLAAGPSAPRPGDRWEYLVSERNSGKKLKRSVEVTAAAGGAVRETLAGDGLEALDISHGPGAYLVNAGLHQLSPYLAAFGALEPGKRFPEVGLIRFPGCSGFATCEATARVEGAEKVRVPAGEFDATRVVVNLSYRNPPGRMDVALTYWYSPAARRYVRASVRITNQIGNTPITFSSGAGLVDYEAELVSMQLK